MASLTRNFTRAALSLARQASSRPQPCHRPCPVVQCHRRPFSVTRARANDPNEEANPTPSEQASLVEEIEEGEEEIDNKLISDVDYDATQVEKEYPMEFRETTRQRQGVFAMDESEDELAALDDDEVKDDAITSMAHTELQEHRELREYARIIAWDMPSLSSLAKPFSLPPETHILRFRYTTYMGESHPAESKVVMELCTKDLTPTYLTEEQRLTFLKLVHTRYNPEKDLVRMSCEKFSTSAQNKRYLGDLINSIIKEAKEGDSFADVPLDLRHHKPKPKTYFPESWAMTEERKAQLEAARAEREQAELNRLHIVDGKEVVANAIQQRIPAQIGDSGNNFSSHGDRVPVYSRHQGVPPRR